MKFALLGLSMTLAVVGQFFLKKGVLASSLTPQIESIIKTLFSPLVLVGFVFYALSSIVWLFVLQRFPLSVAYPALSLTYIVIVVLSIIFLKEPLGANKLVGIFMICVGVYFLFK